MPGLAIPIHDADAIVAFHNIAGQNGVLNNAEMPIVQYVGNHYAARGIDHIPYTNGQPIQTYVLTNQPEMMEAHAAYRGHLANMHFTPITSLQELVERGVHKVVHLPYIRLVDESFPGEIEWHRYGLPPEVTYRLKDKVGIHRWLMENGFAQYTPNFVSGHVEEIPHKGAMMLDKISAMYARLGMLGRYPLGLIIRGAFSDGNYSMAAVVEAIADMSLRNQSIRKGQVMIKPNGNSLNLEVVDTFAQALERVKDHFHHEQELGGQVIMTRLLDIDLSPGMSASIADGQTHLFHFNGQYMAPGNTACTGTTTFKTAIGEERARAMTAKYLPQSQELLAGILDRVLTQDDLAGLYAMLNIDGMMVGELEHELYERAISREDCHDYLNSQGAYDDDYTECIYNPDNILFAEVNPRDTNWTLAMKAVLQVLNQPCTVENLARLAEGEDIQILARDHWELPQGMSIAEARELLAEFHWQLRERGEGIIMRMADNPAGVIIYTPSPEVGRLEAISEEAHRFLARHTAVPA